MTQNQNTMHDIVIVGAGPAGLAMANALREKAPALRIALVAREHPDTMATRKANTTRVSALAAASLRLLDNLGASTARDDAQPIHDMIITDTKTDDPLRPTLLSFAGDVEDGEPYAHMVANDAVARALWDALQPRLGDHCTVIAPASITALDTNQAGATVTLDTNTALQARLVIAADGGNSPTRQMAGIKTIGWDYDQMGIVATVAHERDHKGRAEENFLPSGPFAILPLTGNRSSIVWTEKAIRARRITKGDEFTFKAEMERRFGRHLGPVELVEPPVCFPLKLQLARSFVATRVALIGDAAHVVHPITGQGMNLGLRDVGALADVVADMAGLGLDFGADDALAQYQQWRRFDVAQMAFLNDTMNRLFSNDVPLVRGIRSLGLKLVNRVPQLKDAMIKDASGLAGDVPSLMRG